MTPEEPIILDCCERAEDTGLVERGKYLITQRDAFIDMLKEQAAVCRLKARVKAE